MSDSKCSPHTHTPPYMLCLYPFISAIRWSFHWKFSENVYSEGDRNGVWGLPLNITESLLLLHCLLRFLLPFSCPWIDLGHPSSSTSELLCLHPLDSDWDLHNWLPGSQALGLDWNYYTGFPMLPASRQRSTGLLSLYNLMSQYISHNNAFSISIYSSSSGGLK